MSHAIAQSTKLSVFEQRVTSLAAATQHIPHELAARGAVAKLTLKDASRLTGQLFLQKSAVNLLSTVLDVPEFFWDAADELQARPQPPPPRLQPRRRAPLSARAAAQGLYGTVTKYLELKNRVAVLNARYEVLESMLLMVQQQLNNDHGSRLEWIIIWRARLLARARARARAACHGWRPCVWARRPRAPPRRPQADRH